MAMGKRRRRAKDLSMYYSGVPSRSAAVAISLRTDERRDNVDFTVPPQ
jgi:hypothetical protein